MLLRFGVSNHLSIHGYQELLLGASSLKDRNEGLINCPAAATGSVLPTALVYGANASGKSNLVDALETMRNMVLCSQIRWEPGGGVLRHPFLLDEAASRTPSRFDLDFVVDGVRYHYGFTASDKAFESEWLYAVPRSHVRTLFERTGAEFRFGRGLKGQNRTVAGLTRSNSLFLSAAAQSGHRQLSNVFGYFRSIRSTADIAVPGAGASPEPSDRGVDDRVIGFLKKIDTGVVGCRKREIGFLDKWRTFRGEAVAAMKGTIEVPDGLERDMHGMRTDIELAHCGQGGDAIHFEPDWESAGTQRLLFVVGLVFRAFDEGVPLLADELDTSLHTHSVEALLKLFRSPAVNARGAQLVATTHDTNLLAARALRRDEIWFAEKDTAGATRLYPLTDFQARKGDNIERGYLQGRYGAVPLALDEPVPPPG